MEQIQYYEADKSWGPLVPRRVAAAYTKKAGAGTTRAAPTFLEFFAGSGLVAQGLKRYFRPVWANDICQNKADVYTANHGSKCFRLGSIADVRGHALPVAPLAWASFPCQDLSLAGWTEGIHGARSGLVWEWLRVIDEMPIRPTILVGENVAGLVSSAGGSHYRTLHRALVARGYVAGAMLINADRWVPQSRPRVFVVAIKNWATIPPSLVSVGPNWLHSHAVHKAAEGLDGWIWWNLPEPPPRKQKFSQLIEWSAPFADPEVNARNMALISPRHREMLDQLPKSKRFAIPGYKRTRGGRQVLELRFDELAGCLRTPGGGSSRQVIVINNKNGLYSRLLTVREAARLMGVPERYKIPGSYNDGYKAMGDAVAIPVVRWLAAHLLLPLVRNHDEFKTCR